MLNSIQRARTEIALKQCFSKTSDKLVPERETPAAWAELVAKYIGTPSFDSAVAVIACIRQLSSDLQGKRGGMVRHSDLQKLCGEDQLASLVARCAGGVIDEEQKNWLFGRKIDCVDLAVIPETVAETTRRALLN